MGAKFWLLMLGLSLCTALGAQQPEVVLKLAIQEEHPSQAWQQVIEPWMQAVGAASAGRIGFEVRTVSAADEAATLYDAASRGDVDLVWARIDTQERPFKRTEAFELPFMMSNPDAASRALWEYVETYAVDEFKDVRLLALHVKGALLFHTTGVRIDRPENLQGLTFRTEHRMAARFARALGATRAADPSLAQVHICDWASAARLGGHMRFSEHTDFGPYAALATAAYLLAINPQTYASLPEDLRQLIDRHSGFDTSAAFGQRAQRVAAGARDEVAAADGFGAIRTLPVADMQAFRKASQGMEQVWVKEVTEAGFDGQKLLDGARTLIRKYTQ